MISLLICLYTFSCITYIIKHFKGRYNPRIIGDLNKIIHLRFLIDTYKNKILFLQSCFDNNLPPGYILRRIRKIKCNTINVSRAFLKDEISFLFDSIESVKARLYFNWKTCWFSLSFFDLVGVVCYFGYFSRCAFILYGYCSLNYSHHKYNTKLYNRVKEME